MPARVIAFFTECQKAISSLYKLSADLYSHSHINVREVMQTATPARSAVPANDQRIALALYCELAVQRGSVTDVLDITLLLWDLWHTAKSDNRTKGLTSAPIAPLVQRFEVR